MSAVETRPEPEVHSNGTAASTSLSTAAARNLATTTKSVPQMQEITPRWLLKALPWVETKGAVFRVNRRLTYALGDGRVTFTTAGADVRVVPQELRELALLRDFDDEDVLTALANRFEQRHFSPGEVIVEQGRPAEHIFLVAHGKLDRTGVGKYGDETALGSLVEGDHFTYRAIAETEETWGYTVKAVTGGVVLVLSQRAFEDVVAQSPSLRSHIAAFAESARQPQNRQGEAAIALTAGHTGEPTLPDTFVDYQGAPREIELSVAQTELRVHTRVADLYNNPMSQVEEQLRLTINALRELQEHELLNNREFGLLHNVNLRQRVPTRSGPPTPDDIDDILTRRRKTRFFLAHPRAIAAFGRECNRRGLYPKPVEIMGCTVHGWRNVPILPCNKIPITSAGTTSILAMRTGLDDQGVIGLHQTGLPDEVEPGLNVRFAGIDEKGVITYLVSTYFSAAILVPDALGILEDVQIGG